MDVSNPACSCSVLSLALQESSKALLSQLAVQNPPSIAELLQVMSQLQVK
jgi:hypothetical protein